MDIVSDSVGHFHFRVYTSVHLVRQLSLQKYILNILFFFFPQILAHLFGTFKTSLSFYRFPRVVTDLPPFSPSAAFNGVSVWCWMWGYGAGVSRGGGGGGGGGAEVACVGRTAALTWASGGCLW